MTDSLAIDSLEPLAIRRQRFRTSLGLLIAFTFIAAVGAWTHLSALIWQFPIYGIPGLISAVANWRRLKNPASFPQLAKDSPLYLRLRRIKRNLGWSFVATLLVTLVIAGLTDCGCDHPPAYLYALFGLLASVGLAFISLSGYVKERTGPLTSIFVASQWPGPRRVPSEYTPFYSEHWGCR